MDRWYCRVTRPDKCMALLVAMKVVALAAHNNSLIIFGRRQTLIYTGALTPSTMTLGDTITGIGCVARDSVQMTGEDVIFLSDSGVRSISRTIQEKSAPMRTISRNVNDDIQGYIGSVAQWTLNRCTPR